MEAEVVNALCIEEDVFCYILAGESITVTFLDEEKY